MVYGYDEGVVGVREGEALFAELYVHLLEVHDVEPLVIFLNGGPDDDLLLFGVHIQLVDFGRIGEVSDAPLEAFQRIPS
jgi:hypothetical protein